MNSRYGWLGFSQQDIDDWSDKFPDIPLNYPGAPTRPREYTFGREVADEVAGISALDAGCGYDIRWHWFPHILADAGYHVTAVDRDYRLMDMPQHKRVTRILSDIRSLHYFDDKQFDLVSCISVLEHLNARERSDCLDELVRMTRLALYITVDDFDPEELRQWVESRGLDAGHRVDDPQQHLSPNVSFVAAKRNG